MNDGTGLCCVHYAGHGLSNIDNGKADFFPRIASPVRASRIAATDIDDVAPFWTTMRPQHQPAPDPDQHTLWDEDGGLNGADDHADINPSKNKIDLDFTVDFWTHMLAGDVNGVRFYTGELIKKGLTVASPIHRDDQPSRPGPHRRQKQLKSPSHRQ